MADVVMKFFGWKAAVKKNQRGNKKKHQLKINGITKKNRNSSGGIDEKIGIKWMK